MRRRAIGLTLAALLLAACGHPSGVATNPPGEGSQAPAGTAGTPSPQTSGVRTVLAPLGLNIHSQPSTSAPVIDTAPRGHSLTITGYKADGGGWYAVQGVSTSGWITADPTLSAPGLFTAFSSDAHQYDAPYPQDWTYSEGQAGTVFRPQSGDASILVLIVPNAQSVQKGRTGYERASAESVVSCGYTGDLVTYRATATAPSPQPTAIADLKFSTLPRFAQLWLQLDATHLLDLEYNYDSDSQLQTFRDFYNGIKFPFPQCEAGTGPQTPSPTP